MAGRKVIFEIRDLPMLRPMLVQMIVDGEVNAKCRHRPEAGGRELVVLGTHREIPRADAGNVNHSTDGNHAHRLSLERLQQRILFLNFVELEGMVGGDPVRGRGPAGCDGRPEETAVRPIRLLRLLRRRCRRNNDGDKQSCRQNSKGLIVKHAATIGSSVLLL